MDCNEGREVYKEKGWRTEVGREGGSEGGSEGGREGGRGRERGNGRRGTVDMYI